MAALILLFLALAVLVGAYLLVSAGVAACVHVFTDNVDEARRERERYQ